MKNSDAEYKIIKSWYAELALYTAMYVFGMIILIVCRYYNGNGNLWIIGALLSIGSVLVFYCTLNFADKYYLKGRISIDKFEKITFNNLTILSYKKHAFILNNYRRKYIENAKEIPVIAYLKPNKEFSSWKILY